MSKKVNEYQEQDGFETVASSGFPPMWKPLEDGETVIVIPSEFRTMSIKKGKKTQENHALDCILKGGTSDNFYTGGGKNSTKCKVPIEDLITIPLSYNLLGNMRLAVENEKNGHIEYSNLSKLSQKEGFPILIVFNGKQPIGGGQTVKRFTIQAPKGTREILINMESGK